MPRDVLDRVLNGDKVVIKVKRLVPEARMPERAHEGDKGADVFACSKSLACWFDNKDVICYGTGLALEIPVGYSVELRPRSSVYKTGMSLCNSIGTIDAGYRGEVKAMFYSDSCCKPYDVGDRIAQLVVPECLATEVEFVEVDELQDSERGEGGFGSTGK